MLEMNEWIQIKCELDKLPPFILFKDVCQTMQSKVDDRNEYLLTWF